MDEAARQVPVLYSRVPKGTVLVRKGQPYTRDVIREIHGDPAGEPARVRSDGALWASRIVSLFLTFFLWRYAPTGTRRAPAQVRHLFPFLVLAPRGSTSRIARAALCADRASRRRTSTSRSTASRRTGTLIPAASGRLVSWLCSPDDRIATVYSHVRERTPCDPLRLEPLLRRLRPPHAPGGACTASASTGLAIGAPAVGAVVGFAGAAAVAGLGRHQRSGFSPWQVCLADAAFAFARRVRSACPPSWRSSCRSSSGRSGS